MVVVASLFGIAFDGRQIVLQGPFVVPSVRADGSQVGVDSRLVRMKRG